MVSILSLVPVASYGVPNASGASGINGVYGAPMVSVVSIVSLVPLVPLVAICVKNATSVYMYFIQIQTSANLHTGIHRRGPKGLLAVNNNHAVKLPELLLVSAAHCSSEFVRPLTPVAQATSGLLSINKHVLTCVHAHVYLM